MTRQEILAELGKIVASIRPDNPARTEHRAETIALGRKHEFVFEFAFPDLKVAVEVDKDPKDIVETIYGIERNTYLRRDGWMILSFSEQDVTERTAGVRMLILKAMVGIQESSALLQAVKMPHDEDVASCDSSLRPATVFPAPSSAEMQGVASSALMPKVLT